MEKKIKKYFLKKYFFFDLFFLTISCLIFFTNPLVFQIWSQMFQILTIKPLELFDTNKEQ